MTVFAILVDSRPAYFRDADASLLSMPLGNGTVLGYLRECILAAGAHEVSILTVFEADGSYEVAARAEMPELRGVFPVRRFSELLDRYEPSDLLLLVDPVQFPTGGLRITDVVRAAGGGAVTHLVAAERGSQAAQEHVLLDDQGCVQRIQRYYAGVTQVDTCVVTGSLMSAATARIAADRPFVSLSDLRQVLAARGVPSRDVFLPGGAIDLGQERGLLHLSERILLGLEVQGGVSRRAAEGVYRGQGCRIHPTARLYGPVMLQDEVTLDADTAVIGPALLGAGSRVRRNSVLAQCVVAPRAVVPSNTTRRHRVVLRHSNAEQHSKRGAIAYASGSDREERADGLATTASYGQFTAAVGEDARPARHGGLRRVYPAIKQAIDTLAAVVAIIVLSPVFLLTAAAIKLTSRGPVFFAHPREGKDGREFRCWKFRTMVQGAHAQQRGLYEQNLVGGPQFKLDRDPRITRIGHWLRVTNLDELPQLFNVVSGQMSLIGPRPSPFRENQICVPWRRARLSVRPGITGLWQVCRSDRAVDDFHQWISYDMLYVRHMSALLDLKILFATVLTLGGRWSVPSGWMIPTHGLQDTGATAVPTRVPILDDSRPFRPGWAASPEQGLDSQCLQA